MQIQLQKAFNLADRISDKKFVLIGEATHGTSEFYILRALITQYLIQNHGFNYVVVEGDWPDIYKINQYVKSYTDKYNNAVDVVKEFRRWPTWMWANWEVVAFIEWLKSFNDSSKNKVGFYGMDVYSLWESLETIMNYVKENDPENLETAKNAYYCFEPYGKDAEKYAWSTSLVSESCEKEALELLVAMNKEKEQVDDPEAKFNAEQNALVVRNAERYFRTMIRGGENSWNIRDDHMFQTIRRLESFYGNGAKGIVWAHNTHIGDARATSMAQRDLFNIGQLIRQNYSIRNTHLIGFGTYNGSVIAADEWGEKAKVKVIPAAIEESWETYIRDKFDKQDVLIEDTYSSEYDVIKGQRAVGVVYEPAYDSAGNFVPTNLAKRYDSFIYIDETNSLHPLGNEPKEIAPPDTYPWGL